MVMPINKHNGYSRDGKRTYYIGGGGGSQQSATQVTDLPEWAKPYAKDVLGRMDELTRQPYQTYGGERLAGFTPMQQQAQQAAGNMQVASQIGDATGIAGTAGLGSLYAGQQYGQMATDPGSMQAYMSPYMQNVVDIQKREAQRQADIAGTQRGAQAVRAGAFGGSRQAIVDAEAQRNLSQQMGDIQAKGSQAAFEQARQAQQFQAELGLRGMGQAGQIASTLGQLGQTQFNQQKGIIDLQRDVGREQQGLTQKGYDLSYQDFQNQQRYPYQQLGFMADMIRGLPVGQTATTYYPAPSLASQVVGAGTAMYGATNGFSGFAEGGLVPSYAQGGGISSLNPIERASALDNMGDSQIQGLMGLADISDLAKLQVAEKLQQNAQLRKAAEMAQAGQQPQPQTTIAEEALMDMGLGGLDVPDDMMSAAEGGIISFQEGGVADPNAQFEIARLRTALGFARTDEERAQILAQIAELENGAQATGIAVMPPADLDPGARSPAPTPTPDKPAPKAGLMSLEQLKNVYSQGMQNPADALKAETEALGEEQVAAAQRRMSDYDKEQKELGVRGVEREKYLKEQEKSLKGKEDKAFNMALIEAGLAIMSGTSANAFENIGKGALVGTKAYRNSMSKIEERKDKLNEALFALEDARFSDKKLSATERRALEKGVSDAKLGVKQSMLDLKKLGVEYTNTTAGKAVDAYTQQQRDIYTANRADARTKMGSLRDRLYDEWLTANPNATEAEKVAKARELTEATTYGSNYRMGVAVEGALAKVPEVVAAQAKLDALLESQFMSGVDKNYDAKVAAARQELDSAIATARERLVSGSAASGNTGGSYPRPNQQAINLLRNNPRLKAQFDEKYGPGASAKYL